MPHRFASICLVLGALSACDDTEPMTDAGLDAGSEMILGCGRARAFPMLRWSSPSVGMPSGMEREVHLEFERDCPAGADLAVTASAEGIAGFPANVTIPLDADRAELTLTGVADGTVTLTATATHESGDSISADIEVVVGTFAVPACDGSATRALDPGGSVSVTSGSLSGAGVVLPEGASRDDAYHVDALDVTIGCGTADAPAGFLPLGPEVTFGPESSRLAREIPLTIPAGLAGLPPGAHRGHVEVAYRGPHDAEARIVPIASPRFTGSAGEGWLTFEAARLGSYRAVVSGSAPIVRQRSFTFRGILGFSMGGSGSGRIGFGNPGLFDFVAPLGGPTDWTYMLEHIRNNHIGGFCTETERAADPSGCAAGASLARTPPTTHIHEHAQHFEHWWYDDEADGQGGTFNRDDYLSIFRDLATMFGNPNFDRTADPTEPSITPPGVPDTFRMIPEADRCRAGAEITIAPFDGGGDFLSGSEGAGFFDDEYNPDGAYPVITFCDGAEIGGDIGLWNPDGRQNISTEILLAVDVDGDGIRDPGEPVIRNGREPFDDFGMDGLPSPMEVSADGTPYDAVTNPDPAGDDFHFQYNPTGTENNWRRDTPDGDPCNAMGEAFLDSGLDGVVGTRQLAPAAGLPGGGFDIGEGNGCFNRATGARRMIDTSPRVLAEGLDEAVLRDTNLFADGGIRDLFNWVVMGNVTTAGWSGRGLPVRFYNGHASLHMEDGRPAFDYFDVPWDEVGQNVMIRYGDPDEEPRFIRAGDGGHVGTVQQLVDRLRGGLMVMDSRWPGGDRRRETEDRVCAEGDRETCGYVNSFVEEFTASTGRTGPISVVLPPGYFFERNQGIRYPVIYFLHGYGMSPEDLVAIGLLLFADMNTPSVGSSRRLQKMILVFPDGRCRGNECRRGTFYTDAPDNVPDGAQMQTFLLDLMEHMDANYRTRSTEMFEVVE